MIRKPATAPRSRTSAEAGPNAPANPASDRASWVLGALATALGEVRVVATAHGIAAIEFEQSRHPSAWFSVRSEDSTVSGKGDTRERSHADTLARAKIHLENALDQIATYFAGARRTFDLPLDLDGTDFEMSVWRELTRIPYGETRSYSQIAIAVGRPGASRAAGAANGRNPVPIIVPCHRVIGANGSLVGFGGGLERKRWLLDHESGTRSLSLP